MVMTDIRTRSDSDLRKSVLQEIQWDTRVDGARIEAQADEGVVTLSGTVDCYAEKRAAQEAAQRVAGVLDVVSDIQVRVPNSQFRTDFHIVQAVQQALEWNALVPHEQIQSRVANGWVVLEGRVPRLSDRRMAEQAVRDLTSVRGVINKIEVTAPPVAPQDLRHAVEEALARSCRCPEDRIQVGAHDGVVTLSGRVHSYLEKEAILEEVGHAPGVREIEDCLRVDPDA